MDASHLILTRRAIIYGDRMAFRNIPADIIIKNNQLAAWHMYAMSDGNTIYSAIEQFLPETDPDNPADVLQIYRYALLKINVLYNNDYRDLISEAESAYSEEIKRIKGDTDDTHDPEVLIKITDDDDQDRRRQIDNLTNHLKPELDREIEAFGIFTLANLYSIFNNKVVEHFQTKITEFWERKNSGQTLNEADFEVLSGFQEYCANLKELLPLLADPLADLLEKLNVDIKRLRARETRILIQEGNRVDSPSLQSLARIRRRIGEKLNLLRATKEIEGTPLRNNRRLAVLMLNESERVDELSPVPPPPRRVLFTSPSSETPLPPSGDSSDDDERAPLDDMGDVPVSGQNNRRNDSSILSFQRLWSVISFSILFSLAIASIFGWSTADHEANSAPPGSTQPAEDGALSGLIAGATSFALTFLILLLVKFNEEAVSTTFINARHTFEFRFLAARLNAQQYRTGVRYGRVPTEDDMEDYGATNNGGGWNTPS